MLGSKYLARKKIDSTAVRTSISLNHMSDGIRPILEMVKLIKPTDKVTIEFDWHNIRDDMCPIIIHIGKEAVRTT